ncbi:MAG: hypothetical protein HQ504_02970 [Rhodospirillaceae bacterium]|nr:hypothetical protein [Rhodospirillaceae bacterium]
MNQPLPEELRGWNWGAFLLNWVWGLGNRTYISFLVFIPVANIIMPFVLGAKGNEWAWHNDNWHDVEHFRRVQRNWAWVGVGSYIAIISFVSIILFSIFAAFKSSIPYNKSLDMVRSDTRVERVLGSPIVQTGWLMSGNINISNDGGNAAISYDIGGPNGEGTVNVSALRKRQEWTITGLVVSTPGKIIDIIE